MSRRPPGFGSASPNYHPRHNTSHTHRIIWPLLSLLGFASCLSDEPMETMDSESLAASNPGSASGPVAAIPAGGIIDTQPNSGWTEGGFNVNPDGAATYHLPLWVPYGRGGLAPSLSLDYNSQAGNGPLGVGWSLTGLSSVTHCPRTVAQDGYNAPPIWGSGPYCLDGQRLQVQRVLSSGEIEYRTEQNSFAKIVSNNPAAPAQPDYFKVWTKDGRLLVYGNNDGGRLLAFTLKGTQPENPSLVPTSATRIIDTWGLREIYDRRGNSVNILYQRIESSDWAVEFVPSLITYGPDRRIEFTYTTGTRPDPFDSFEPGLTGSVRHRLGRRLNSIAMKAGSILLRQYNFGYQQGAATGRSQLISVTECDGAGVCMNALDFDWHPGSFAYNVVTTNVYDMANVNFAGSKSFFPLDINGDGRDDLIYSALTNPATLYMRMSTPTGYGPATLVGIPAVDRFPSVPPALRPIDFDLDGKIDLLVEVPASGGTKFALYRSTGTTYQLYSSSFDNRLIGVEGGVFSAFFADIDGNGLPDYVAPTIQGSSIRWWYRLNLGTAFAAPVDTPYLSPKPSDPNDRTYQVRALSLNGGTNTQILLPNRPARKYDVIQLVNGIFDEGFFNLPFVKLPENQDQRNLFMADVNGDGLQDAIYPLFGLSAQLNSGSGFTSIIPGPTDYIAPTITNTWTLPVRAADFDGDGADDIAIFHLPTQTAPSDLQIYSWRDHHFVRVASYPVSASSTWGADGVQLADWNGDGHIDILNLPPPAQPARSLRILRWTDGSDYGQPADRLLRVNVNGLGLRAEVFYTSLANHNVFTPGTCSYPLMCPVRGGIIVSDAYVQNGLPASIGSLNAYQYRYEGLRVDLLGRGSLGYASYTVKDFSRGSLTTPTITTTLTDNISQRNVPVGNIQAKVYPFARLPIIITRTVSDPLFTYQQSTLSAWSFRVADPGTYSVSLTSTTEVDAEALPGDSMRQLHSRTDSFLYDGYDNIKQITTSSAPGPTQTTVLTYYTDASFIDNWFISKLKTKTVTSGGVTRTSNFTYWDDATKNLKDKVVEPNDNLYKLTTSFVYDVYGNITSVTATDATGPSRTISYTYDSNSLFLKTATNALNHVITVTVDSGLGVPISRLDPNNIPQTMKWDRFGRLREVNYADGYFERYTRGLLRADTTVPDGTGGTFVNEMVNTDSIGRTVSIDRRAFKLVAGDSMATILISYDQLGRPIRSSRPFLGTGSNAQYTTYEYDLRDRLIRTTAPDGVVTRNEYRGLETHHFDGKGIESYTLERADGRLDSRYEEDPKSTGWLKTAFTYGAFGQITNIAAPGTIEVMVYDRLGRKTSHTDPSTGATTTAYNAFGETNSTTNALGQVVSVQTRDLLGRPTRVQTPNGDVTYIWDTATNGKGKLQQSKSPDNVVCNYSYNTLGQTTSESWNIENQVYQVDSTYDSIGRLQSITYPQLPGTSAAERLTVNYGYNLNGYLLNVADAQTGQRYWQVETRRPDGQLENDSFGERPDGTSPVTRSRSYISATGRLLNVITRTGPSSAGIIDDILYNYDANRNVFARTDMFPRAGGKIQRFTYDTLNRLQTWTFTELDGSAPVTTTFDYEGGGNLLSETVTGRTGRDVTYLYENTARPELLTKRNGVPYTYDDAGRQITGPDRTIAYNYLNLPKLLTHTDGSTVAFTYDADGARVLKRDATETVVSVAELFERRLGSDTRNVHYVVADGMAVAQVTKIQATPTGAVTGTELLYLYADGQGNVIQTTNAAGQVVDEFFYDPFGRRTDREYNYLGLTRRSVRKGYTGHAHDDELEFINMKGRVYDPFIRRFISPDPFVTAPLFGQSYNPYSYVWNNPATFTDPSGFGPCADVSIGIDSSGQSFDPNCNGTGGGGGIDLGPAILIVVGTAAGVAATAIVGYGLYKLFSHLFGGGHSDDNTPSRPAAAQASGGSGGSGGSLTKPGKPPASGGGATPSGPRECSFGDVDCALGGDGSLAPWAEALQHPTFGEMANGLATAFGWIAGDSELNGGPRDSFGTASLKFMGGWAMLAGPGLLARMASTGRVMGPTLEELGAARGGGGRPIHSRYGDGAPVYRDQRPARLPQVPDPAASGPHSRVRYDGANGRVYQTREYDAAGNPVRDVDLTSPTYPNGALRPDHAPAPHQHPWQVNDPTVGPRSGYKRGPGEPL